MRILFVTSNSLGDAVLSTGVLNHLLRTHPHARFTIACGPVAAGVFARMPRRERTIVLRKQPYRQHWLTLWTATVRRRWDLVVDVRGSGLAWLLRTRRRAVMRKRAGHKTAQLAAMLGVHPPPLPVVWTAPEDEAHAAALLPASRPIVALAPTANWPPKTWAPENFAALFAVLRDTILPDAVPVVLGGPGEAEHRMAQPLLDALPTAIDLVGTLSIPQAAAVLRRAALFAGNDSGLMHLAAAAGAPTLGLFGPTHAGEYAPAGPRAMAVVAPEPRMEALPVAQVLEAAQALMAPGDAVTMAGADYFPAATRTQSPA